MQARIREHALGPWLELDVTVVKLSRYRTFELKLVGLEIVGSGLSLVLLLVLPLPRNIAISRLSADSRILFSRIVGVCNPTE